VGKWIAKFWRRDEGQDLVEYTLLLMAIALAGAAAIMSMGSTSSGIWNSVNSRLANANGP
jgi:Flp pilus assembly pilin Flp